MLCPSMLVRPSIVPVYNKASFSPSTTIYLYRNVHRYRPGTTYTACGVNKAAEHPVPSDTQPCPAFLICHSCHIWCKTHTLITKKLLFLVRILLIFDWTNSYLINQRLQFDWIFCDTKVCDWTSPLAGVDCMFHNFILKSHFLPVGNTQAPVINVFLFALSSSGVLRACKDTVAGWGGPGVLREIQWVPAYRLCTIVSKSPPVQAHGDIILSLSKLVVLCVKEIYRCTWDIIYTYTCDQPTGISVFSEVSGLLPLQNTTLTKFYRPCRYLCKTFF